MKCPQCEALRARVQSSGLGGRWKVLCAVCGYRYDESDGDSLPAEPAEVEERGE